MTPADLPLVIATSREAAVEGLRLLERGEAYGVVYVEDAPEGRMEVRYYVGAGHEHRIGDIEAWIEQAAAMDGARVESWRVS